MNLHKVRGNGCVLHYPVSFNHPELIRGGKGYVVDLDAPFEKDWCGGQEWKLEPAGEGSKPNAIVHPIARRLLVEHAKNSPQAKPVTAATPATVAPVTAVATADAALDETVKRKKAG